MTTAVRMVTQSLVVLVLATGAYSTEIALAVWGASEEHECGCLEGCACRGFVNGGDSSRTSFKTRCGCGCDGHVHHATGWSWQAVLAPSCEIRAPNPIWACIPGAGLLPAWRLEYVHRHPPRSLS